MDSALVYRWHPPVTIRRVRIGNPVLLLHDELHDDSAPILADGLMLAMRRLVDEGMTFVPVEPFWWSNPRSAALM
jgi:ABC-type branched-subunit amino acid transport system ATPase component